MHFPNLAVVLSNLLLVIGAFDLSHHCLLSCETGNQQITIPPLSALLLHFADYCSYIRVSTPYPTCYSSDLCRQNWDNISTQGFISTDISTACMQSPDFKWRNWPVCKRLIVLFSVVKFKTACQQATQETGESKCSHGNGDHKANEMSCHSSITYTVVPQRRGTKPLKQSGFELVWRL